MDCHHSSVQCTLDNKNNNINNIIPGGPAMDW